MMEVDHYQLTWGCHLEAGADRTESRLTGLCSLQDGEMETELLLGTSEHTEQ